MRPNDYQQSLARWTTADGKAGPGGPVASWFRSLNAQKAEGSGLQHMRNGYYDPKTGRFTQEDPIGLDGGLNLYGFAKGDPVNFSDPFGQCPDPNKPWCSSPLYHTLRFFGVNATADRWAGIAYGGAMLTSGSNIAMMGPIRAAPVVVTSPRTPVALNAARQGKHIPGHNNYISGRSVLTHNDPQKLLDDFAGTG